MNEMVPNGNDAAIDPKHNVALIRKAQVDIRNHVEVVLNALRKETGLYATSMSIDIIYAGTLSEPYRYVLGAVELEFRVKS